MEEENVRIIEERGLNMKKIIVMLSLIVFTSTFVNAETFSFSYPGDEGKIKPTCTCPDDHPLLGWEGYCHSCDETDRISLKDEDSCEHICDGKDGRTKRVKKGSNCVLEKCPADKPLEDTWGACESCDFDGPLSDTKNCSLCPNRKVKNKECVIADCSNRPLVDTHGNCYPCSTELDVTVFFGKCSSICSNRFENGSWTQEINGKTTSGTTCSNGDSERFSGRNQKEWKW